MPDANKNSLESKPGKKSQKHPLIICADLECLLLKMNTCNNNPNKSYATAKALHLINWRISKLIIEKETVWKDFAMI